MVTLRDSYVVSIVITCMVRIAHRTLECGKLALIFMHKSCIQSAESAR